MTQHSNSASQMTALTRVNDALLRPENGHVDTWRYAARHKNASKARGLGIEQELSLFHTPFILPAGRQGQCEAASNNRRDIQRGGGALAAQSGRCDSHCRDAQGAPSFCLFHTAPRSQDHRPFSPAYNNSQCISIQEGSGSALAAQVGDATPTAEMPKVRLYALSLHQRQSYALCSPVSTECSAPLHKAQKGT